MAFYKKTIRDIELNGKKVLLRADYNVPIKHGIITDDYRIKQSLPTVQYLLEHGASVVIISHLGRPKGKDDKEASLEPAAGRLSELLDKPVRFVNDCVGEAVSTAISRMQQGEVVVLENVRYYEDEEKNSEDFARQILDAVKPDYFVQDGFGVVHRAHASTEAIARQGVMAVAGLLLEREVDTITRVMQEPERPMLAIVGGAKISDKIEVLYKLIDIADAIAITGAMANTFLAAERVGVGASLVEKDAVHTAKDILSLVRKKEAESAFHFVLPVDVVVSTDLEGQKPTRVVDLTSHSLADITDYPKKPSTELYTVGSEEKIFDIGPISAAHIAGMIQLSKTVVWNGTCGVTEAKGLAGAADPFSHGTKMIVDAMIGRSQQHANRPFTLVGGGDTVGYVESEGLVADFGHVSTGGGASLELMSGKVLPGVNVLWDK